MPKIALFQDYLAQHGGAERVTEAIHRVLPEADLHTTLSVPEKMSPYLRKVETKTTWMQYLPAKSKLYRHYFLFYPFAVESAHLADYDLIVSSCCGYAKGVKRGKNAIHVCYCHNPMRWVWRFQEYMAREIQSNYQACLAHDGEWTQTMGEESRSQAGLLRCQLPYRGAQARGCIWNPSHGDRATNRNLAILDQQEY